MLSFKEQGAGRAVAYIDRMLQARDRDHLRALPDALAIALRLEVSQLAANESQIGDFLVGFKETFQLAFDPVEGGVGEDQSQSSNSRRPIRLSGCGREAPSGRR